MTQFAEVRRLSASSLPALASNSAFGGTEYDAPLRPLTRRLNVERVKEGGGGGVNCCGLGWRQHPGPCHSDPQNGPQDGGLGGMEVPILERDHGPKSAWPTWGEPWAFPSHLRLSFRTTWWLWDASTMSTESSGGSMIQLSELLRPLVGGPGRVPREEPCGWRWVLLSCSECGAAS